MTPLNPQAAPPQSSSFVGFAGGAMVGLALLCLGGAGGYVWVKKAYNDARKGWNLVPVVVAAQDIPEGTVVTIDLLSQRSVPEQFVTASVVKPDKASSIVGRPALAPMNAGDPLLWSAFEKKQASPVLFVKRDAKVGELLTEADLEVRVVEDRLLSSSWVGEKFKTQVTGRKVSTELRTGDPMLWTHLEGGAP